MQWWFSDVIVFLLAGAVAWWGARRLRLRTAPDGPMRTLQLGRSVTDPAEKLALAHRQGWMAIVGALAAIAGTIGTRAG